MKIIKSLNAKNDEGRIYEHENQLKAMHFTTRDDISLFIFLKSECNCDHFNFIYYFI